MKFKKEDAYKELVGKLSANGETPQLSERSINEQLETLIPLLSDDEMELQSFVDRVFPILDVANKNVRHDVGDAVKKYKEDNPVPPKDDKNPQTEAKITDPTIKALMEKISAFEKESEDRKAMAREREVKASLLSKMKELGIKDENWAKDFTEDIQIGENFDVDATAKKMLERYNKYRADDYDEDATPRSTSAKKQQNYTNDIVKQAAEIAKANRLDGGDE